MTQLHISKTIAKAPSVTSCRGEGFLVDKRRSGGRDYKKNKKKKIADFISPEVGISAMAFFSTV